MNPDLSTKSPLPGENLDPAKMPGHWLLARMGKRVLRPGGLELTRPLLDSLHIGAGDTVVELAPGMGATARMTLEKRPARYIGVERNVAAAAGIRKVLRGEQDRCVIATAAETGLDAESVDVVYGEAMLSMQTDAQKSAIVREAFRILKPGGLYGIHELGLKPDDLDDDTKDRILKELSSAIHVGVRPLTITEWSRVLGDSGFDVDPSRQRVAPMHLLEPGRMIADEGVFGTVRIAFNVVRTPVARRRILQMRKLFHRYDENLCAVALVACKPRGTQTTS